MCKPCKLVPNVFLNGSVCIAHRDMSVFGMMPRDWRLLNGMSCVSSLSSHGLTSWTGQHVVTGRKGEKRWGREGMQGEGMNWKEGGRFQVVINSQPDAIRPGKVILSNEKETK